MKESLQEENKRKTFYDGIGSKYKGEITEIKPFNLTDEREGRLKTEGTFNSFIISQKLRKSKRQKLTPGSTMMKSIPHNTLIKPGSNLSEDVELKKDFDKIEVHENTNLSKLA